MSSALSKAQIISSLAEKAGITKAQAETVVEGLAQMAYEGAAAGFKVPGLGKLMKVERVARMGRNPATGQSIQIPARTVLKFRIAKEAKDAVLGPKK